MNITGWEKKWTERDAGASERHMLPLPSPAPAPHTSLAGQPSCLQWKAPASTPWRPWLPLSPHEEVAPHHRHSSSSRLSNPRWPCIFLDYKKHKQDNWICFQVWSAGVPSCPNERGRTPKDAFSPAWYSLGDSGNWGDGISFWNDMFLCCFEHKSDDTTASWLGPTHVSFQEVSNLLLPFFFFFFCYDADGVHLPSLPDSKFKIHILFHNWIHNKDGVWICLGN